MLTTLNKIREHSPCTGGWEKLLTYLGKTKADAEPLSIATIIDSNGLDDALWCLRAVEGYDREIRLYAVWCARQVQHLLTDKRSLDALGVAERYANGQATLGELHAASAAAEEDAADTAAARSAARDAATAAWAARYAVAYDVARAAARAAAWAARYAVAYDVVRAAWNAAWAARAAGVARDAAWAAAREDAREKQEAELRRICGEVEG